MKILLFYSGSIICDFSYFKTIEYYENKIEQSEQLQDLDDEFRENHIDMLTRFYHAFESIHTFVTDLNRYICVCYIANIGLSSNKFYQLNFEMMMVQN